MSELKFARDFIELYTENTCSECFIHPQSLICFIACNPIKKEDFYHLEIIKSEDTFSELSLYHKKIPTNLFATQILKSKHFFLSSFFHNTDTSFNLVTTPLFNIFVADLVGRTFYSKESYMSLDTFMYSFISAYALFIFLNKNYYFLKEAALKPSAWDVDFYYPDQILVAKFPLPLSFAISLVHATGTQNFLKIKEYHRAKLVKHSECEILSCVLKSYKRSLKSHEKRHRWLTLLKEPNSSTCPVFRWFKSILKRKNIISTKRKNTESCEYSDICKFSDTQRSNEEHQLFCNYSNLSGLDIVKMGSTVSCQARDLCIHLLIHCEQHEICDLCA